MKNNNNLGRQAQVLILLLTIGGFILAGGNLRAESITIASDNWCPFNCEPNSPLPGYMVEIAQKVFQAKGHKIVYKIIPWARAVRMCRAGKINGVIGGYKEDTPDFIFPKEEQGMIGFQFFTLKENNWHYNGLNSLSAISLAVIRDYAYSESLDNYISKHFSESNLVQVMSGETPLEQNIKKLLKHRVDAVLETGPVFWYTVQCMGVDKGKIKSAGIAVQPKPAYIAFSPAIPKSKEYANILSEGMKQLRSSGQLSAILAKYGLEDWK